MQNFDFKVGAAARAADSNLERRGVELQGRMSNKANDPKWRQRQMRLFTNFCNAKLCEREDVPPVTNLFEDMKDGKLLYALLEELSGQSLAPVGRIKRLRAGKTATRIDNVANLSICFRYIKQTTKIVGIGPGDIADGNETIQLVVPSCPLKLSAPFISQSEGSISPTPSVLSQPSALEAPPSAQ